NPWDPTVIASFSSTRTVTPSTSALEGASTVSSLSQPFSASYNQLLDTGTQYTVNFAASKSATNSGFNNYNPAINSGLQVNMSQPLLRNRGRYVNRLGVMVARSNLRVSEYQLRNTLITAVSASE